MADKNEVAEVSKFNLVTMTDAISEDAILDEMDGLGSLSFDRIKIPSGGGLAFEVPGEDEDNPDSMTEINCVILDHGPVNAYWKDSFSGENASPDCSSFDGKTGTIRETGEKRSCKGCPYNEFGSDGGKGKACKNIHRLYILMESNPVPMILSLPPTSIKGFRDYVGKKIVLKGFRCWQVITKITLKKEKNAGGVVYSRAVFSNAGVLSPEDAARAEAMRTVVSAQDAQAEINADDYSTGSTAAPTDSDGFMNVPEGEGENLPFD